MIAVRYTLFALLASMLNLAVQHGVWQLSPQLFPAMACGTLAGLFLKYWLDKRWIFVCPKPTSWQQFGRYAFFGGCLTLLFWLTEWLFYRTFGTIFMRDVGAALGLVIGYVTKYQLDKRYVFTK